MDVVRAELMQTMSGKGLYEENKPRQSIQDLLTRFERNARQLTGRLNKFANVIWS